MLSLSFSRALSPPRASLLLTRSLSFARSLAPTDSHDLSFASRSLFSLFLLSVTGRSLISSPFLSLFLAPLSVQSVTLLPRSLPADRLTLFHGRRRSLLRPLARVRSTRSLFQAWFPWSGANVHHVHRGIPLVSPTFGLHSPPAPFALCTVALEMHASSDTRRASSPVLLPFSLGVTMRFAVCNQRPALASGRKKDEVELVGFKTGAFLFCRDTETAPKESRAR